MQEKIDLLKNVSIFSQLKKQDLSVVARYSHYDNFNRGETIFSEGSHSEELYIIKEGEVLISKHRGENEDMALARFIPGEIFGELDLLDNTPRTAVAVAEKDTTLLIFPKKGVQFKDILQKHPEIFARILHKLLAMIAGRIRTVNQHISEKTPLIQDLRRQLLKDKLTGLYNRTFLEEDFKALLPGYGVTTSLVMIKPDNFKYINDTFGHDAGDRVLKLMAAAVKSGLRGDDIALRYRGDEFTVILPDTGAKTASLIAEELRSKIYSLDVSCITGRQAFQIAVSIGVCTYPVHADDTEALIAIALKKMFDARNSGGNLVISA